MVECPRCNTLVDSNGAPESSEYCPGCGEYLPPNTPAHWVDVARVSNLAEAGFLTDELIGSGIDARIHQLEEFNAAVDRRTSQYLIRVPADLAQDAAALIRPYLSEDPPEKPPFLDAFRFSTGGRSDELLSWRPIAIAMLAGVAGFSIGQTLSDQNVPRRASPNALSTAVGAIGRPLVTEPTPNQPRFRLSFDRRQQLWTLETDRDNDGRFESSRHFRVSGSSE